jgi:septal ring factor EnvC (AmiA/AmiB activator)
MTAKPRKWDLCNGDDEAEIPAKEERHMKGEPQGFRAPAAQAVHPTYKSPQRKLVTFFHKSRDQWKGKCREAKAELKKLKKKLRGVQTHHQRWQSRVKALEEELARLHEETRALEEVGEAGKKKER